MRCHARCASADGDGACRDSDAFEFIRRLIFFAADIFMRCRYAAALYY